MAGLVLDKPGHDALKLVRRSPHNPDSDDQQLTRQEPHFRALVSVSGLIRRLRGEVYPNRRLPEGPHLVDPPRAKAARVIDERRVSAPIVGLSRYPARASRRIDVARMAEGKHLYPLPLRNDRLVVAEPRDVDADDLRRRADLVFTIESFLRLPDLVRADQRIQA